MYELKNSLLEQDAVPIPIPNYSIQTTCMRHAKLQSQQESRTVDESRARVVCTLVGRSHDVMVEAKNNLNSNVFKPGRITCTYDDIYAPPRGAPYPASQRTHKPYSTHHHFKGPTSHERVHMGSEWRWVFRDHLGLVIRALGSGVGAREGSFRAYR